MERLDEVKKLQKIAGILKESVNEGNDLLSLIRNYIDYDYTVDQGWGDDVDHAEQQLQSIEAEITAQKGPEYFKIVKDLAGLMTYDAEYANAEEAEEIAPQIEQLASELGFTADQIKSLT